MIPRYTPTDINLTPIADPLLGSRLTTSLLLALVAVFAATGEEAGLIVAGALFCVAWPAFIFVWSCDTPYEIALPALPAEYPSTSARFPSPLPFALPTPAAILSGMMRMIRPALPAISPATA